MISSHSADRVMHFNSHAHVERDRPNVMEIIITHDFNSHAHVERDIHDLTATIVSSNFNSHAHVERD